MDPAAVKFLLDEIGRKFDEADARFDRLFARLQQPTRGSTSFPCNGDLGDVTSTDPDTPLGSGADSIPTHAGEGPLEPAHGDVAVGGLGDVGAVLVLVEAATRRRTPMLSFVGNYSQPHDNQTSAVEEAMVAGAGDPGQLDQLLLLDPYAEDDITNTMPTRCSTLILTPTPTTVIKAAASATSAKPAASTCSSASAAQGINDCGGGGGWLHRVPRRLPRPYEVPDRGLLCNLLCSVPLSMEGRGWADNQDYSVSCTFGADVVADFLRARDMDLVCRAHQVVEDGYEFFVDRQLVTVFPATNYCGEFHNAAVMTIYPIIIKLEMGSNSSCSLGCSTKCPSQALHNIVKPSLVAVVTIAGTPSSTLIDAQVVFGEMQPREHRTLMTATIELRFVLWNCFIMDWVATQQKPQWPPPVQLATGIQLRPVPWPSCYAGLVWLIKSLDQVAGDIPPKPPWLASDPDNLFRVDYSSSTKSASLQYAEVDPSEIEEDLQSLREGGADCICAEVGQSAKDEREQGCYSTKSSRLISLWIYQYKPGLQAELRVANSGTNHDATSNSFKGQTSAIRSLSLSRIGHGFSVGAYKDINKDGKPYIQVKMKDGQNKISAMKDTADAYLGALILTTVATSSASTTRIGVSDPYG
jgi:hypothetical protein